MKPLYLFLLAFWPVALVAQTFPKDTILNNGPSEKRVNLVFMSDGYLSSELNNFENNATSIYNTMFAQTPFLQYKNFFNVYTIRVPSVESGAKHAGTATDVTEPASPITNPNNYFGSRFDVSNIHRLLVPSSTGTALSIAATNVPNYDQVMMVVNTTVYGGSGGTLATGSINGSAAEIMIHEVGHSFASLGDEYWFNCSERKNRTANNNPLTIIWKNWLNSNGIGIYQISSSGPGASCYRPHQSCKMQLLGVPFCAVCKEAFIDRIYNLVSPIETFTPASNNVAFVGPSMDFELDLILPNPNTLKVQWLLNGTPIANNIDSVNITAGQLLSGNNTLQANVTDSTDLSRAYWPATSGYLHSVSWTISYSAAPVELLDFDVRLIQQKSLLNWQTASEAGSDHFDIEKSENGTDFRLIGQVKAAGHSSTLRQYTFTDPQPLYGVTYYRLKQVDRNQEFEYSPVKTVNRIGKLHYDIFPNPADAVLYVNITGQSEAAIDLYLYDLQGKLLRSQQFDAAGAIAAEMPIEDLPAGTYTLVIKMGETTFRQLVQKL